MNYEVIYAYEFEGKRYDVGDKLGYLIATVEFAMMRDDLKEDFKKYLIDLIKEDLPGYREAAMGDGMN
ncbi:MAG: UTP--glucose-phosphate uridylyltransferase [Tepidanaerobacteraceae bacterium]|nr:UTP--glucose-phosphate uridylyltransferase [Tepidanaerobacteraceae bacterium]